MMLLALDFGHFLNLKKMAKVESPAHESFDRFVCCLNAGNFG